MWIAGDAVDYGLILIMTTLILSSSALVSIFARGWVRNKLSNTPSADDIATMAIKHSEVLVANYAEEIERLSRQVSRLEHENKRLEASLVSDLSDVVSQIETLQSQNLKTQYVVTVLANQLIEAGLKPLVKPDEMRTISLDEIKERVRRNS